jgi:nucleoside-diphosphate-sugar epimerase
LSSEEDPTDPHEHRPGGVALVTGASGFIGSHLVDALVEEGWRVRAVLRERSSARWLPAERVEIARAALDGGPALRTALAGVRVAFHLAGLTSAPSPSAYRHANVTCTEHLLRAAREVVPGALVVHCSSLAAAGPSGAGRPLREDDPPRPIGPYGISKLEAERTVQASGLDHVIVRPPAVYGPRDADILTVFRLARRGLALRTGPADQRLSLVHVRDLAHGLLDAAERGSNRGVFYVSDGEVHSWREVVAAIGLAVGRPVREVAVAPAVALALARTSRALARATGTRPLLTPERARDLAQAGWACDDGRARRELDYRSRFDLDEGMRDTAAWYVANGWL